MNRLDEQILFNALTKDDICKIIDIELDDLFKRIEQVGYKLNISDEAKMFVADQGYDPQYGARPLKRAIQKYLEDLIAETIISGKFKPSETLFVEVDKDNLAEGQAPEKLKVSSISKD